MLFVDQWFSHMDAQWDVPPLADLLERLASFSRLIMFDNRGSGLSDPVPTAVLPTIDDWVEDMPVVLDAVNSERAALVTNIGGGFLAMSFAAAHPEWVSALVLVDCFARFLATPDFPIGAPPEILELALEQGRRGHGARRHARPLRPEPGRRRQVPEHVGPVRAAGRQSRQHRGDRAAHLQQRRPGPTPPDPRSDPRHPPSPGPGFRVEHGRYLAQHIPGAKYVELPGIDNMIWAGDREAIVSEIQAFLTGVRTAPEPHRVLATVLFTDIVGSTRLASDLGDERWQALLAEHHPTVRRALERFGGREVKTVGDGFLATFESPARAIRCAAAIRDGLRDLGIDIRSGLHIGEIEVRPDDIAGLAVHIGARISALADAGEILVSGTVRELVVGSGFEFEDRGSHVLKGVPGEWRIYAARV